MHLSIRSAAPLVPVLFIALAGCETVAEAVEETYTARMTGAEEVPGPGDPDGTGTADVTIIDATDSICYELKVSGIAPATAAHIHRGTRGVAGPPVVTLEPPTHGERDNCVAAPEGLADEIEANPAGFYVNVHNAEYPNGAIRGQLVDLG